MNYYRIMLGGESTLATECFAGGFVGTDFGLHEDLTESLPDDGRAFNKNFIPAYMKSNPAKSKISAGIACAAIWTVSKGIMQGDMVLCHDGKGHYHLGEVVGDYAYAPGGVLPHRRPVRWLNQTVRRADMSGPLRRLCGSPGTVKALTKHTEELVGLIGGSLPASVVASDETIEDPTSFALEKHLEDFLVQNWGSTELSRGFDVYEEEGEQLGQQFPTDTGPIDILAISKDRKTLLVIELKKGRASDAVVGQALRYMGYVQEVLAEPDQSVKGVVIALEDSQRLQRALAMVPSIDFYRYEVSFKLVKV